MIKNLGKKKLIFLFSWVIVSAIFLGLWVLMFNKILNLKNENTLFLSDLKASSQKIGKIKNVEAVLSELTAEKESINDITLNKDRFINFVETLEFLSQKSGAALDIKSAAIPENDASSPRISLIVKGDFQQVFTFIKMAENLPYFISFDRVVLQKNSDENLGSVNGFAKNNVKNENNYKWMANVNFEILSYEN